MTCGALACLPASLGGFGLPSATMWGPIHRLVSHIKLGKPLDQAPAEMRVCAEHLGVEPEQLPELLFLRGAPRQQLSKKLATLHGIRKIRVMRERGWKWQLPAYLANPATSWLQRRQVQGHDEPSHPVSPECVCSGRRPAIALSQNETWLIVASPRHPVCL